MTVNEAQLRRLAAGPSKGIGGASVKSQWMLATDDTLAAIEAPGYFNSQVDQLVVGDQIFVSANLAVAPTTQTYVVSAKTQTTVTVRQSNEEWSFHTRDAAVAAIASGLMPKANFVYYIQGEQYIGAAGASALPGLPGLLPVAPARRAHWGVDDLLGVECEVVASGGMSDATTCRTKLPPLVIFVSGQSNAENLDAADAATRAPLPRRVRHWSYYGSGIASDEAATNFVGEWIAGSKRTASDPVLYMSWGRGIAEAAAEEYPDRPIYILSVAKGGLSIAQWIDGAAHPRMMTAIRNNVPVALAAIEDETGWPVEAVDVFGWRHGESDYLSSTYRSQFDTFMDQLWDEDWFRRSTPIVMSGMPRFGASWEPGNKNIMECVAAEPEHRVFVDPGFLPIEYWYGPTYVHMTNGGYRLSGRAAWDALQGRGGVRPNHRIVYDSVTGRMLFGDGRPGGHEFTFAKNQNDTTSVAISNNDTGAATIASLLWAAGLTADAQIAAGDGAIGQIQVFGDGRMQVRHDGIGNLDIQHDREAGLIRWIHSGQVVLSVSSSGLLTGIAITQSAADATAGRLIKVGDFGLGGQSSPLIADLDAASIPGGMKYRYDTAASPTPTTGTLPSGAAASGWVETVRFDGGTLLMVLTENASALRTWRRRRTGGTWGAWQGPT
jgi:hypothetical protein